MRRVLARAVIAITAALLPVATSAQSTTTYHLHQEASAISSLNRQLKTANPDSASTTILSINLKNLSANQVVVIEDFETQTGVPNLSGTIPAGSVVTFLYSARNSCRVLIF